MKNRQRARFLNRLRFILDKNLTVANLLTIAARSHGDMPLFYTDKNISFGNFNSQLSLKELENIVLRLGLILEDVCCLKRHDRVAILKENNPDIFFIGYSVMSNGKIAVPINGGMKSESAYAYLSYTGSKVLITDLSVYTRLSQEGGIPESITHVIISDALDIPEINNTKAEILSLPKLYEHIQIRHLEPIKMLPDEVCLICHTSGTTGFPKGVIHTCESLVNGIKGQLKIEPISSRDMGVSASPFNHFINFSGLMSAMAGNVRSWVVSNHEPAYLLDLIDKEKISVVFCFPHTYLHMYEYGLEKHDLSSVRLWLAGADSSHEAHIKPFIKRGAFLRIFGKRIINSIFVDSFGSSEVGFAALFRFTTERSSQFQRYVGKPTFAGPRVKVATLDGEPVKDGEAGCLMVKGPTLFRGYWNNHEKTLGEIRDGWWWTGDIARKDNKGRFFHLDRAVDVIKTTDGPIYSLPVEEKILLKNGINEAVLIGVGPEGMQRKVALIQTSNAITNLSASSLKKDLNSVLEDAEELDEVYIVQESEIPRGLTGKVLKRVLREKFNKLLEETPASQLENRVAMDIS